MNSNYKSIATFLILVVCIMSLLKLQMFRLEEKMTVKNTSTYIEQEKEIKAIAKLQKKLPVFGFDNIFADWAYLQFLQYFGDTEARKVTGYSVVTEYFETVIDRDPKFIESHFVMSAAHSLFTGRPEKTVELLNEALKMVTPKTPGYPFYLWTYKATDEILFLGDLEAAKKSYQIAAKWAEMQNSELGDKLAIRFQNSVEYLANNPDPTQAQFGSWMSILSSSRDKKVKNRVLEKLEELGAEINISPDGKLEIKPPKNV